MRPVSDALPLACFRGHRWFILLFLAFEHVNSDAYCEAPLEGLCEALLPHRQLSVFSP